MMERIAWFRKIKPDSILLVGKKAFELNNLYSKDYPVAPGFVVTADAYKEFLFFIEGKISVLLDNIESNNQKKLQESANQIQRLILAAEMPEKLEKELEEAYDSMDVPITIGKQTNAYLFLNTRQKAKVLVRSSPVALNPESVAGEFASYLNVEGIEQLKRAVKACWASVFTSKSIGYRAKNNYNHKEVYNAVIVQKMVQSEKSGVVHTVNPANANEMLILAIRGYIMGLNEFEPSRYVLDKNSNKVRQKKEVGQRYGYFGAEKGRSVKKELPYSITNQPVLDDMDIIRLSNIAKDLEAELNTALKIEFLVEDERVFINDLKQMKEVKMRIFRDEDEEAEEPAKYGTAGKKRQKDNDLMEDVSESDEIEETSEDEPEAEEISDDEEVEETDEAGEDETEEEPETEETSDDGTEEIEEETDEVNEDETEETEEETNEAGEDETEETEEETNEAGEDETEETEEETNEAGEDETEETEEDEPEETEDAETSKEEEEPEEDKEQQLNELFEDYSKRINQLLEELREESLRIVRD
jgi:phosphoenolpyruvate synthase/pyruvate phosphate dikinase